MLTESVVSQGVKASSSISSLIKEALTCYVTGLEVDENSAGELLMRSTLECMSAFLEEDVLKNSMVLAASSPPSPFSLF